MDTATVLKAISDGTRIKILALLLKHNYCVRALAKELSLSQSTISQHLKVLREAGLLVGEKRGYFMHYDVARTVLHELAAEIEALAAIEREACVPQAGKYEPSEREESRLKNCGDASFACCHGKKLKSEGATRHGKCKCRPS